MSDQAIAERVELDKKDKSELQAIVTALGGKASSRLKKADLIDSILELSGVIQSGDDGASDVEPSAADAGDGGQAEEAPAGDAPAADGPAAEQQGGDTVAQSQSSDDTTDVEASTSDPVDQSGGAASGGESGARQGQSSRGGSDQTGSKQSGPGSRRGRGKRRPDEPPAEWETELQGGKTEKSGKPQRGDASQSKGGGSNGGGNNAGGGNNPNNQPSNSEGEDSEGNRRRRRRGRGRDRDDNIDAANQEPIEVTGILDLRDDGYGFLRVDGLLPSKDDVYVPVKMARQFGLRRGDLVTGVARAANRNEKNPALQQLDTVNGSPSDDLPSRPEFDKLTPLFPDERLRLERERQPLDLTARIIDLIAPIGKGQRGLIVSPPKAGKTTIMKEIATSIEQNHPEVELIVLLVDERPEEVTDMRRHLPNSDVVASTFDRPTDEHCAVAELTIERAKRVVEEGKDVVVIVDGITRLARAYNMAASGTGRVMSGGVDAGALYPPKKFLGAARNLEEGGSLTILATALVETGSRMDEVIFEEFKGTGNMELRLDRNLAERYVFPAIDALGSSTRRDELLMDGKEHHASMKLRKVLAGMSSGDDGAAASAMNLLIDRLKTFKTNEEFLQEIARS